MPRLIPLKPKTVNEDHNEEERPSHWHEDQNERDIQPNPDFQTSELAEQPVYGFVPPPNPVPVYLTEPLPGDNSMRQWSPQSATITSKHERIAGADRRRTRLLLTNNSTDKVVYIARRNGDLTINAYPLSFGREVELFHNDEVWAYCLLTDTVPLGWFVEFNVEDL